MNQFRDEVIDIPPKADGTGNQGVGLIVDVINTTEAFYSKKYDISILAG